MRVEADLDDLFYAAIQAFAATEGVRVSFPNVDFDPDKQESIYLKPSISPITPEVKTVCGGIAEHIWILQVMIYVRRGTGERNAKAIADRLAVAFPVTHVFRNADHAFVVIRPPSPVPPIVSEGWVSIPVQMRISNFSK